MSAFDIDSDIGLNKAASGASAPKAILPFLYAGNVLTANEKGFLKRDGINIVLDLSPPDEAVEFKHKADYTHVTMFRGLENGAPTKTKKDDGSDNDSDDDSDDEASDTQAALKTIYSKLKDIKASNKKVLVYSNDYSWLTTVIAAYMLQSSKALDKYLALNKALEFLKTKDPLLDPAENLLELVVLEEELFDEVSVKLPSNSRGGGKKGTVRKGSSKGKGGRR